MAHKKPKTCQKFCFVTVGATATFDELIGSVLAEPFVSTLINHQFTHLVVQYGQQNEPIFTDFCKRLSTEVLSRIKITGFDVKTDGIKDDMLRTRELREGEVFVRDEGAIISHAGTGSILDALRLDLPLIVVPNPSLLDNHQEDLARVLADQQYLIHGHLSDLPAAIQQLKDLRLKQANFPLPITGDLHREANTGGFVSVIDEEAGFWMD